MCRSRAARALAVLAWLVAVPVLVVGCRASTDRHSYAEGDAGTVTLVNISALTEYLPGCQPFHYEKLADGAWVEQPPDFVCVWEGIARPVPPRSQVAFDFAAREPGRWRLRFEGGVGCTPGVPLSQAACARPLSVVSNEFEVRGVDTEKCQISGCSSELCASEPLVSACVFLPHYACFRDAQCSERGSLGPLPGCGWELTSELLACLAEFGVFPEETRQPEPAR